MAESIRAHLRTARLDAWHRVSFDAPALQRALPALLAAGAVLAVLLLVQAGALRGLPGYPAAVLAFAAFIILPGLFVHHALMRGDAIERVVLAVPFGLAVAAPAGLLALWLGLSLDAFVTLHTCVAAIAAGASMLLRAPDARDGDTGAAWNAGAFVVAAVLIAAIGAVVTMPVWGGDELARNFDEWRYMTYVNSYLHSASLEPLEPVGIGEAAYPRMAINVWLVLQAAIAGSAGVSAEDVVMDDLTPILTVLALGATYVLAKTLLRRRDVALLAAAITLGYAFIDISRDEGLGPHLLFRMSEDKMAGTYILFPLGLALLARFFEDSGQRTYAAFALLSIALFVVHPQPLLFLAVVVAAVAAMRLVSARSLRSLVPAALLGAPIALLCAGQFLVWHFFNEAWPTLFRTELVWRENFKIVRMPGDMIMGNFHLILHPLMIAAIALAPVLWLRARGAVSRQVLLAASIAWLPLFLVPPLTTSAAKIASSELVTRLPLMTPVAVVLAYAVYLALDPLLQRVRARPMAFAISTVAPAFVALLLLGGAMLAQDASWRVDGGTYYTWSSHATIVPGTDASIFLGGKDRILSGEWRRTDEERDLFAYLDSELPPGARVLAQQELSLHMPGVFTNVLPVHSRGVVGLWEVPPFIPQFYSGNLTGAELTREFDANGVEYVVVTEVSPANEAVRALPSAQHLREAGPYQVYRVR